MREIKTENKSEVGMSKKKNNIFYVGQEVKIVGVQYDDIMGHLVGQKFKIFKILERADRPYCIYDLSDARTWSFNSDELKPSEKDTEYFNTVRKIISQKAVDLSKEVKEFEKELKEFLDKKQKKD